jgi:hypothetical protein
MASKSISRIVSSLPLLLNEDFVLLPLAEYNRIDEGARLNFAKEKDVVLTRRAAAL